MQLARRNRQGEARRHEQPTLPSGDGGVHGDSSSALAHAAVSSVCDPDLCFNGGRCGNDPAADGGVCVCVGRFIGRHCLQTICDLNPCANGGACLLSEKLSGADERGYTCACPPGFTGAECRLRTNPCQANPCSTHGICIEEDTQMAHPGSGLMRGRGAFSAAVGGQRGGQHGVRLGVVDAGDPKFEDGYRCQCHLWWTGE